ncbi:MAG TPA: glycoside hydrolase family 15 protein [Candidatus Nitrosotalea sp.]|nr:glycoside hydrolase family 15 protein [Candidatus Nitrosotalea sp.]
MSEQAGAPEEAVAPGAPGVEPGWGPGPKQAFGTAASSASLIWYTLAKGNLSEVFHPSLDRPLLRGLRFIAAAPGAPPIDDSEEGQHRIEWEEPGVPVFSVRSEHPEYRLNTQFVTDPQSNALIITGDFQPEMPDVRLFLQLEPHESGDARALGEDPPWLSARLGPTWLALVGPFSHCSVGYRGRSDLLTQLRVDEGWVGSAHLLAESGWVALGAQLGLLGGPFQLALGLGADRDEAEEVAREALRRGGAQIRSEFVAGWRMLPEPAPNVLRVAGDGGRLAKASMAVLRCLEDKLEEGGFVAAPTAPWGVPDQAYNRVWNRDLFHIASALLDAGDVAPAQRALSYLSSRQGADGSWPQSYRLDGSAVWAGSELDQLGYPILLAWRLGVAGGLLFDPYPELVRRAAAEICRQGPATDLDRWEDAGGYSPSSLAVSISALVLAAAFADESGDLAAAYHFRLVADYWNEELERWTFHAPFRHYVRLGHDPDQGPDRSDPLALEFLELSRRGLRRPQDPRLASSLLTADPVLEVELPAGRAWRRYSGDTYGEAPDGRPWPAGGSGVGRPWPLLTGERAHQVLALGGSPAALIRALEGFAGPELILAEQLWDADDVPERGLRVGLPSGSAAPLGWAHAEYLRLLVAYATAQLPDATEPVRRRYADGSPPALAQIWHERHRFSSFPAGRQVKIQLDERGAVTCSADGWASHVDIEAYPTGLGLWVADLPSTQLAPGHSIEWRSRNAGGEEGPVYSLSAR